MYVCALSTYWFDFVFIWQYGCYKEIYRVLKPGQHFAAYEWCMTDSFDPNNQEHQKIKVLGIVPSIRQILWLHHRSIQYGLHWPSPIMQAEIEIGDGLPDIRLTGKCLEALKQAGFEVSWKKNFINTFHFHESVGGIVRIIWFKATISYSRVRDGRLSGKRISLWIHLFLGTYL